MLTVVCEVESNNYYLFLDGKYVENSKLTFHVEFKSPSALRVDTAEVDSSGAVVSIAAGVEIIATIVVIVIVKKKKK